MMRSRPTPARKSLLVAAVTLLLGLALFVAAGWAADEERGILADLISRALSTPTSRVTIGKIDGALSSNATIHDIVLSDRDGVWLKLDRARIVWRRLALVQRRLEVDDLDLGTLTILRKPIPAETPVAGEDQPLLPQLPVKVEVKQFALSEMIVGQPILGIPARFSMGGYGTLGAPSEGLELHLDGQRLDRPASLTVRLTLVPDSQKLALDVALNEPAGGLVSTLANIPGQPAVTLHVDGNGSLDAFGANLAFDAGPEIGATGKALLKREGAARRLGLDLSARIAGFVPALAAPVLAGTTTLRGDVVFGDDRGVAVQGVSLGAAAAQLDIAGTIDPAGIADLTVAATSRPNTGDATALGEATIRRLDFRTHVTGALSAPTIRATLALQGARLPSGTVDRLDGTFEAVPTGAIGDAATLLRFSADAHAEGLALANPALAQAVGASASLATRGTSTLGGQIDFETLALKGPTLSARYAGRAGGAELRGHLDAEVPDLARFGAVAGSPLRGAATLSASVEGTPRSNRFAAVVDARASRFATGVAAVDGLFGGTLALAGGVRLDPDGGFAFDQLALTGPNATARLQGAATPALADVTAAIAIPDLARADGRLSGRAAVSGHLTGTLDHPDATARIAIDGATLMGKPVSHLDVMAEATGLRDAPDAHLALTGDIDRKPARAALHVRRAPDGLVSVDGLDAAVGSVSLTGALTVDADALADGRLTLKARDLDDLSPLLLHRLAGSLDADIVLARAGGGQSAAIKAAGQRIAAFDVGLDRLTSDLSVQDLYRRPVLNGMLAIDAARVGGETISSIRIDAKGTPAASDVALKALARGFAIGARARVVPGDTLRVELQAFDASRGAHRIGLAGPTTIVPQKVGAELRNLVLALDGGRLSLDGHVGAELRLRAVAHAFPLGVAAVVAPDLSLGGTLDGEATLAGPAGAPTGDYRLQVAGLVAPQTASAGLPPIAIAAKGHLDGRRATIDAGVTAPAAGALTIRGSLPMTASGALDLAIAGKLDAALANRTIAAGGRSLTGAIAIDGRLAGPLQHPQASGAATLSEGTFTDAAIGIHLEAIRARLVARGDTITIESASAATRDGGTIGASGQVRLDAAAGFPGSIKVTGQNARLVQSSLATGVVNLNLAITGALARDPRLGGRVDIVALDIPVPERLAGRLRPLPGTRHIHPTPTAARRLALDAKKAAKGARPFDMTLDLTIAVPGRIHVYGRGLGATLGGGLRLTGTLAQPRPVGAFNLVRGNLQILTANLDFSRANLTFAGDLSPELDFLATTQAGGASIGIAITGQPSDPQFTFTSSPDLPQDEILSRLLFGAPAGQLSTTQALSLASAAAQYSTGGGGDALEGLRRSLGLGAGGLSNNPLTNALGNRVSVGVHTGVTPAETGVGVDVSVFGPLKVKGAVNANGGTSVGVGAEHEW